MKRFLIILVASVAIVLAIILGVVLVAPNTPPGRSMLIGLAERQASNALNSDVSIGALEGRLPSRIIIKDVVATADGATWLELDEAVLDWRPSGLLGKKIFVDNLLVNGLSLHSTPPPGEPAPAKTPKGFTLPDALPAIEIDRVQLRDVFVARAIAGVDARLQGDGSMKIGGRDIHAALALNSPDAGDVVDIDIRRDAAQNTLIVDAAVKSPARGLLAGLAKLEGPLDLTLSGDAPVRDYVLKIDGALGAYGAIDGSIRGDLERREEIAIALAHELGAALAAVSAELGPAVQIDARLKPQDEGLEVEVSSLATENLSGNGVFSWTNGRNALEKASAALNLVLAEGYRPEIVEWFGDEIAATVTLSPNGETYSIGGEIAGEKATILLEDGDTDLAGALQGTVSASLAGNDASPLLSDGARLLAEVKLAAQDRVSVQKIDLKLGDGAALSGDVYYLLTDESVSGTLRGSLGPARLAALTTMTDIGGPLTGRVELAGRADDMRVDLNLKTPSLVMSDRVIAPGEVNATASGLPKRPKGRIDAASRDGADKLLAVFATGAEGAIDVSRLDFAGPNFTLNAKGRYEPKEGGGAIDLTYSGAPGATPAPGVTVVGDVAVVGALSQTKTGELTLTADALAVNETAIEGLSVVANGPTWYNRRMMTGREGFAPRQHLWLAAALVSVACDGGPETGMTDAMTSAGPSTSEGESSDGSMGTSSGGTADDTTGAASTGVDTTGSSETGSSETGDSETGDGSSSTGGPAGLMPNFELEDVNPVSVTFETTRSPEQELGRVSAWYFIHAT